MTAPSTGATVAQRVPGRKVVGALLLIHVDQVHPNPANVRRRGGLGDLTELAASIRAEGILEPLLVEDVEGLGDAVRIVAGHRRYAAAKLAGLREVPCIIRPTKTQDGRLRSTKTRMLIENLHRRGLHPLDEADAYYALIQDGMTIPEIAHRTGISAKTIRDRLALRDLPDQAQQMVRTGDLRLGQATQLARQVRTSRRGAVTTGARAAAHFTLGHPLREAAKTGCDLAGHPTNGRVGGVHAACGACWEAAIRNDERRRLGASGREAP